MKTALIAKTLVFDHEQEAITQRAEDWHDHYDPHSPAALHALPARKAAPRPPKSRPRDHQTILRPRLRRRPKSLKIEGVLAMGWRRRPCDHFGFHRSAPRRGADR